MVFLLVVENIVEKHYLKQQVRPRIRLYTECMISKTIEILNPGCRFDAKTESIDHS